MKVTYVDTTRMREIGDRINKIALDYEKQINIFFKRMTAVPTETKEWTGDVAIRHARLVALEKNDYLEFSKRIRAYAKKILDDADAYDARIKSNQAEEAK